MSHLSLASKTFVARSIDWIFSDEISSRYVTTSWGSVVLVVVVVSSDTGSSSGSTITTTLPGEVVTYLEEISSEKIQSIDLATKVLEANDKWDNEDITYQEAKDEFANFIEEAQQFVETVSEPGPPTTFAGLVKSHEELKSLVELIFADTEELLEGLTSSDTGERRSAALDSFNNNINLFQEKIDEIVAINTSG